jgi:hypothetical protein
MLATQRPERTASSRNSSVDDTKEGGGQEVFLVDGELDGENW